VLSVRPGRLETLQVLDEEPAHLEDHEGMRLAGVPPADDELRVDPVGVGGLIRHDADYSASSTTSGVASVNTPASAAAMRFCVRMVFMVVGFFVFDWFRRRLCVE